MGINSEKGIVIAMVFLVMFVAFAFTGCIDTDDTCLTCGEEPPENETNMCGAHHYGYPSFPVDHPLYGESCMHSEECLLYPPSGLPNAELCCVNDGTCYGAP
jgi:hypothetical protein